MDFPYKTSNILRSDYGTTAEGKRVSLYYLMSRTGCRAEVLDYGGIVHSLILDSKDLIHVDMVVGSYSLAEYEREKGYFYCTEEEIPIYASAVEDRALVLRRKDENTEEELRFAVTEDWELVIGREISVRKGCVAGLRPFYLNMAGLDGEGVLDHAVLIEADRFWGADGAQAEVEDTPLDFRSGKALIKDFQAEECQLTEKGGYDHLLLLNRDREDAAATVYCSRSGVYMDFFTTAPAVYLHTLNLPDGYVFTGKKRLSRGKHSGFCLLPAPLPDTCLQEGEIWSELSTYRFSL